MKLLEKKTAIVTGGGSGIGKAIALLYSSEGAKIIISDIDEKGGNETVSEIKAKGAGITEEGGSIIALVAMKEHD